MRDKEWSYRLKSKCPVKILIPIFEATAKAADNGQPSLGWQRWLESVTGLSIHFASSVPAIASINDESLDSNCRS